MNSSSSYSHSMDRSNHPSPADFEAFVPWACFQYQVEANVFITRSEQSILALPDKRGRKTAKAKDDATETEIDKSATVLLAFGDQDKIVKIQTIYDQNGHLVQLKFLRNSTVPRDLLKIILFIIPFYPHLTNISIDKGLRGDGLYELGKIVSLSKITELVLDNTVFLEANYYILLDKNSSLKYLSLARCKLNDRAVNDIAKRLLTSSLSILNLTSNRITDIGASHLGKVLRFNRKLTYLNLAGNLITDVGAASILNCLMEFPLCSDEIKEKKERYFMYLKEKNEMILRYCDELRATDTDKKISRKKIVKPIPVSARKSKVPQKQGSLRGVPISGFELDGTLKERAEIMANVTMGPFQNPFSVHNTVIRNGVVYCLGNNSLCYLGLAYNDLTYFSVKLLLEVLSAQDFSSRTPRGLVNVCIEGNRIPDTCYELTEIDFLLQSGVAVANKTSMSFRKRPTKVGLK